MDGQARHWWESGKVAALLVLVVTMPLWWPALPPLADLPGHMGRWHIAMALPGSADLARYYDYRWSIIPNLGLDLLVPLLARAMPFEAAAKLAVTAIPAITAIGLLWTAREVHGRVPPTAILALPLVYAWPFQSGFVNFALAQGLTFCALALWLRLGQAGALRLRGLIFAGIGCVLWIVHSFGWGLVGLMAAGADLARLRGAGWTWPRALAATAVRCLPLALPLLWMLAHSGGGLGAQGHDLAAKAMWIVSTFRDRWQWLDIASLVPPLFVLYVAARSPALRLDPVLGWPALLCLAAFALLPRLLMGGAYVDARMVPAAMMLGLIAIRPPEDARIARLLALLAVAFLGVRLGATTASFVLRSGEQQHELAAIASIPRGAAVLALVARPCGADWSDLRRDQLPSMAIVRRDAFTNAQWALPGQQALRIRYTQAAPYLDDPSQQVLPPGCARQGSDFGRAIASFPRAAFTHVWTIGFPPGAARADDLAVVWTNGASTLYAVRRTR